MSRYVECFRCGDPIPSGAFCYRIIGQYYCEHCGQDELEYRFGTFVDDADCDEDEDRRDAEWKEWSDECKEDDAN